MQVQVLPELLTSGITGCREKRMSEPEDQATGTPSAFHCSSRDPWVVHGGYGMCVKDADGKVIAVCRQPGVPFDEADANAPIMAAAPSMLRLIGDLYDGIHRGQGRFASASDGEIAAAINDTMCNLLGNDWR